MKILVFGGGGFIGSAIVDRLLLDRHQVRVFERPRVALYRQFTATESIEWVTGEFSSATDVTHAMIGVDVVLHLVSTTLPKTSNDDPIYDVQSNLVSTLKMLNVMIDQKVRRIIFISSGGTVYGKPTYVPIDELHPTEPMVSYGITKLAIEKYLQLYQHLYGLNVTILRVANPYGERQRIGTAQGAVTVFLDRALKGLPIEIWGDGSVTRDYLHVSDVAEAFARAVGYSGAKNCFNISSGSGTSLNELVSIIREVSRQEVEVRYFPGRSFDVPVNVLSNDLARTELNWVPSISMHDGIGRVATWMRSVLESKTL